MILKLYLAQPVKKVEGKLKAYVTMVIRCMWCISESRSLIRAQISLYFIVHTCMLLLKLCIC